MKERTLFACNFKFSTLEREGNWSRNVSRNCLWDRYCWRRAGLILYADLLFLLRLRKKETWVGDYPRSVIDHFFCLCLVTAPEVSRY